MKQYLGWWSAGVTSAVAIKFALEDGLNVMPIYFETGSSHQDNARFKRECEKWYGRPIMVARNSKYSSVLDLIKKRRYLNGPAGALCTSELKKEVRFAIEKCIPYEGQIFGFESHPNEIKRAERFKEQYPAAKALFPLIEREITKANALHYLKMAGIDAPMMYRLGFRNNNCIMCVKGGMGYFNKMREHFPKAFAEMAAAEREVGHSCIKGVYLDELAPGRGNYPKEIEPECGIYCPTEEFA